AVARLVPPRIAVVDQRIEISIAHGIDAAAAAAVAAVGAAEGDELLATEAHAAVAPVAGDNVDGGFVDEFHDSLRSPGALERAPGLVGEARRALQRLDVHRLTVLRTLGPEAHLTVDQREQRVVLAGADIGARMELGAALAHDDRAGRNGLAAEHLHAEHLRLGITAVPGGTAAFFLCHGSDLLDVGSGVHRTDFDLSEVLAM